MTISLKILQLTDTHILATPEATLLGVNTAQYFQKVVVHAFTHYQFDLILLTGDLAQDPCSTSYQYINDILNTYNTPCVCLPGNHDDYDIMQYVFGSGIINCYKHILLNHNWQFISLNSQVIGSANGYLSEEELTFLETCLDNHPNRHALIATHHHCLNTQSAWMDEMIIENHPQLFATIGNYPQVKAIIHGHIHQALDINEADVRVLGTPSTCFQFKPKTEYFALDDTSSGYRVIVLHSDGQVQSNVVHLTEPLVGLHKHATGGY